MSTQLIASCVLELLPPDLSATCLTGVAVYMVTMMIILVRGIERGEAQIWSRETT
jgi:hypothetical protein